MRQGGGGVRVWRGGCSEWGGRSGDSAARSVCGKLERIHNPVKTPPESAAADAIHDKEGRPSKGSEPAEWFQAANERADGGEEAYERAGGYARPVEDGTASLRA